MQSLRVEKLQKNLESEGIDLLIIEDSVNLYYLTDCDLSTGSLLLFRDKVALLVDGRYTTACQQKVSCPIYPYTEESFKDLFSKKDVLRIGFDSDAMSFSRYSYLKELCSDAQSFIPLKSPVNTLRVIKEAKELDFLREAAKLGSLGYDYAASLLKPGCSEEEIAKKLEIFWLEAGGDGLAFSPIIAFGANSALPHHRAGESRLQNNDCALIDIGVKLKRYHSDMTRVCFIGTPHHLLYEIYAIVAEAQQAALKICKAGVTAAALDSAARSIIAKYGYAEQFSHGLGHGVGLEIHEAPRIRSEAQHASIELKSNMVITIEPGIYLPGVGGVRLENTIIVTDTGYEDLTQRGFL